MEFVSELIERLEDEERPFPKRMRLAKNAYYATGGSSEGIMAWICSRLKSISQEDFSEFSTEWRNLVSSVHSQHIRPLVKLMLEVVNKRLTDYNKCIMEDIFTFVISVLENARVQNYFFTDLDTYFAFIQSLLSVLASGPNKDESVCKKLFETMEVFARMVSFREYPVLYLDHLLLPSVHLVRSVEEHSVDLEKHLLSCIRMAAFRNAPHLAAFLNALLKKRKKKADESKQQTPSKGGDLKSQAHFTAGHKLLEKLCSAPSGSDKNDVLFLYIAVFKCLAKIDLASIQSKATHSCFFSFKMLMVICPLIKINVDNAKLKAELPDDLKECHKGSPDELSFDLLDSVLSVILKESLPFPDNDELEFVNWIECLWRTVLSVPLKVRQSGVYLRCLTTLLRLHPRVVMNRQISILTDVLVILDLEKEIPEFILFLQALMSIHHKGFSMQELLISIFSSSKQLLNTRKRLDTSTLEVYAIVPPSVFKDIQKYAADWTSTPVHEFMDYMTTQLKTLVFSSENQRSIHSDTSTAVAVRLLCGVLSGARIVDHCGNDKIRRAYVSRLNSLSHVLKQMGAVAKTKENMVLMQAFLDLEKTWAAVALMLQHYSPEASEAIKDFARPPIKKGVTEEHLAVVKALSHVHAHIAPVDWSGTHTMVTNMKDRRTHEALVRLEVQSLRYFIMNSSGSGDEVAAIAKEVLPHLVSSMDLETMVNDIYCVGKYLEGDELMQLVDKLVEILVSSNDEDKERLYTKHFSRLQENKYIVCGMVWNLLWRLETIFSSGGIKNTMVNSQKILHKLTRSGVDISGNCVSEQWDEILTSLGKWLHKAFKKLEWSEMKFVAEQQSVKQILNVLNLIPLEFLPENFQSAVIFVMFGLSVDLVLLEESEDKSSLVYLIYHQLIYGMLERWVITSEAPPLQRYVNIAELISHVKFVTNLQSGVDVNIVRALLGISLRSEASLNKILETFFSGDAIPADGYVIQGEMLHLVCKNSLNSESREVLKSSDCESRVVSFLLNLFLQQRPKKHLISIYTLLLSRNKKKSHNLEALLPVFEAYCKISLKILRNEKQKRVKGEEFVCEVVKYHGLHQYLPPNFLLDVWNVLLKSDEPSSDIASLLFSEANRDDFESKVQRIMKELECTGESSTSRANVLAMWEALIQSHLVSEDSLEKRSNAISFLLSQQHVFLNYPVNHLLKVLLSIVECSRIVVFVHTVDHILQALSIVMNRKNQAENIALIQTWFAILNKLLFHRSSQTLDCLPAFTAELRLLIQNVVTFSRQNDHLETCISILQEIEKMFQTIVKAKLNRNFIRIGAYILADLLKHFEGNLPREIKVILENIACEILGFLDYFAQRFLGKVVTPESGEILKEIDRIRSSRRTRIV